MNVCLVMRLRCSAHSAFHVAGIDAKIGPGNNTAMMKTVWGSVAVASRIGALLAHFVCCLSLTQRTLSFSVNLFQGRFSSSSRSVVLYAGSNKKSKRSSGGSGGGGGGFGTSQKKKNNEKLNGPTRKQILKRVEKVYGGTSPEQIARATQERIQTCIREQPPPVQMALQLYQQLQQWESHVSQLSVLEQAQLDPSAIDGANRARQELDRLYKEHESMIASDQDLHNLLQRFTWDASADAKVARSIVGDMNAQTVQSIERACAMVAEVVLFPDDHHGLCLDVGCGFGILVPFLVRAGIPASNIHGVDLSAEMIRNAKEQHPAPTFTACDFLNEYPTPAERCDDKFRAVIFCSSLHDLPDPTAALAKATSLLDVGGRIVIVHPQGASHVLQQRRSNPVLVKRGLPNADELGALPNLQLIEKPPVTADQGYLAVLRKTGQDDAETTT